MANFQTHLSVAAGVSGILATTLLVAEVVSPTSVVLLFFIGTIGGLLPDIDSEPSIPIRLAFTSLALLGAFLMMFHFITYSLIELLIIWLFSYLSIRYLLLDLFTSLTVHRGLVHSLPTACMACLITVMISHYIFHLNALLSWFYGVFLGCGFVVHLLLDEIYSANLLGVKKKKPFGTALSLGSFKTGTGKIATIMLYGALFSCFHYYTPPFSPFGNLMSSKSFYNKIGQRLLPSERWFKGAL